MKLCVYKEHHIEVSDSGKFSANGIARAFDTLELLKLEIDKETRIKYVPVKGLLFGDRFSHGSRPGQLTEVVVTRPSGMSGDNKFWVTHADKKREVRTGVFLDTPESRAVADKIIALRRQADILRKEADAMVNTLPGIILEEQQ